MIIIVLASPVTASQINLRTIPSSGRIGIPTSPLHVDGRYIKNSLNQTVYLRGVWKPDYLDSCVGWWGDPYSWNENNVRAMMNALRYNWGINVINIFVWGDWWLEDKSTTLNGQPTSHSYRWVIKETLRIAQEYDLYVQIRLYSPIRAEGRVAAPFQPYSSWTVDDFYNFWINMATELKNYNNAIFTLYDEPNSELTIWFDAATAAINEIRSTGAQQIIVVHYAYCGSSMWMENWIQQGRPLENIVFSNHIYRYHGTFRYDMNSPVDIEYIRDFLSNKPVNGYTGAAYGYITNTYNVPIWVSAIGSHSGSINDQEYVYFKNTLQVLNELGLGYVAYQWFRTDTPWATQKNEGLLVNPPNRVGQALIDAIRGEPVPPTHQLAVYSEPSKVSFSIDDIKKTTPYDPQLRFEGQHIVEMSSSIKIYNHTPLFGNTEISTGGKGYSGYSYTAGPYTINSPANVSTINLYTTKAGKAKVAVYNATTYPFGGWPEDWPHPDKLIVESSEFICESNSWNTISILEKELLAGTYFFAVKIDTNGMLSSITKTWFGQFGYSSYKEPFPESFGTIVGGIGGELSVYVPLTPIQVSTYNFDHWDDGSTIPERTINLNTDMTLTATYNLSTGN